MSDIYATDSFHMHHHSINNPVRQMYSYCRLLMTNCNHSSMLFLLQLHLVPNSLSTPPTRLILIINFLTYANSKVQTFNATADPASTPQWVVVSRWSWGTLTARKDEHLDLSSCTVVCLHRWRPKAAQNVGKLYEENVWKILWNAAPIDPHHLLHLEIEGYRSPEGRQIPKVLNFPPWACFNDESLQ